jgi:hypothetical protein
MTEIRYRVQAIDDQSFGDPEIIIFSDHWNSEHETWIPDDITDQTTWPHDENGVSHDPDQILNSMGYRVIEWENAVFGFVGTVEPT